MQLELHTKAGRPRKRQTYPAQRGGRRDQRRSGRRKRAARAERAGGARGRRRRTKRGRPRVLGEHAWHKTRPQLKSTTPVHVGWRVVRGLPNLRSPRVMAALRTAFRAGKARFGFRLVHFSVQHNHIHMLCEADDAESLARGLQGLAVRIARRANKVIGRKGGFFRDRYWAKQMKSPTQVRWALMYVLNNARKHSETLTSRRYARRWIDAACSSAAYFDGWNTQLVALPTDEPGALVTAPTGWLLRGGWRRGGGETIPTSHIPSSSPVDRVHVRLCSRPRPSPASCARSVCSGACCA